MSEHDRGAYTPPTDDYLAFDARTTRVRRPIPATLLGSAVVLVVLIGAVVLFYQSGVRGANEAPEAVGKPVISIKSPPVSDAKPITEDGQELQVYNQEKGQGPAVSGKPAFAPPPEEPGARPLVQADTPPPATGAAPPATRPMQTATQTAPPPVATAAPPAPTKPTVLAARGKADPIGEILSPETAARPAEAAATARPVVDKPAPTKAVPAKPAPAKLATAKPAVEKPAKALAASAPVSGVSVQFGAFSSAAIADSEFAKTKAKFGSFTAGKPKHVEKTEVSGKTFYRAAFTGFTKPQAKAFCEALIAAKGHCIIR
jgi:hypothetical protein